MDLALAAATLADRYDIPDVVTGTGISLLCGRTARRLANAPGGATAAFAGGMDNFPVAEHTTDANAQHYEVPAAFFAQVLGPHRKYSSCFYATGKETLLQAEEDALALTAQHAQLAEGQAILELGCGWGSLTLWMAEHFPRATITAVSNSTSQREYIEGECRRRRLGNVRILTADMNMFSIDETFDRIVSVEMFEHMANWHALLKRARGWLKPDGRMFVHVFTHARTPYRFDRSDKSDWIANYFFTGGIMPSRDLIAEFPDCFRVEEQWQWDGTHYRRTARDWLHNFDRHQAAIMPILKAAYGEDWKLWRRRWRLFFLATAGMFGHGRGGVWGVSHYRLKPVSEV